MRKQFLCQIGLVVGSLLLASPVRAENYAFLVAVQDYDVKTLRPLKFTRSDIEEFAAALKMSGFKSENIVLMSDKTTELRYAAEAEKIRKQLDILLAGLVEGDTLIVALAGHGVQFQGDDKSYFCPADADLNDPNHARLLPIRELYRKLKDSPAQRKLLIVDACRNDPASTPGRSRESLKLESITRPQIEPVPKGVVAFFSCAAGQEAFEWPDLKHGVFFHYLLEGWKGAADDGDQLITLDEIVSYAKLRTQTFARTTLDAAQTPQLKSNFQGTWVLRDLKTRVVADEVKQLTNVVDSGIPNAVFGSPSQTAEFDLNQRETAPITTLKTRPAVKPLVATKKSVPKNVLKSAPLAAPLIAPQASAKPLPSPGLVQVGILTPEPAPVLVPSLTAAEQERNRDLVFRVRASITDEGRIAAAREIIQLGDAAEDIMKTLCAGMIDRNERVRMLSSQSLAMINPEFYKLAQELANGKRTSVTDQNQSVRLRLQARGKDEAQKSRVLRFGRLSRALTPILWSQLEKADPVTLARNDRSRSGLTNSYIASPRYKELLESLCDVAGDDRKLMSLLVTLIKSPDEETSSLAMLRVTDMGLTNQREVVAAVMTVLQRPLGSRGTRIGFRTEMQTDAALVALGKLSPFADSARGLVRRVQAIPEDPARVAVDVTLQKSDET